MQMNRFSLLLLLLFLFTASCKEIFLPLAEEEDCHYKFGPNLPDICGVWEPKQIIDLEHGDTLQYVKGEGRINFIFKYVYANAFELRPDSTLALYYVESGRHCKTRVDARWYLAKDTLYVLSNALDNLRLPVVSLNKTELTLLDEVNFKRSRAVYRKSN